MVAAAPTNADIQPGQPKFLNSGIIPCLLLLHTYKPRTDIENRPLQNKITHTSAWIPLANKPTVLQTTAEILTSAMPVEYEDSFFIFGIQLLAWPVIL